ncbi:hypothetical protein TYRP_014275, partial [Tyrophagus putrescentiae]
MFIFAVVIIIVAPDCAFYEPRLSIYDCVRWSTLARGRISVEILETLVNGINVVSSEHWQIKVAKRCEER